jgi:hypothetical protein
MKWLVVLFSTNHLKMLKFVYLFILVLVVCSMETKVEMKNQMPMKKFIDSQEFTNLIKNFEEFHKIVKENHKFVALFSSSDKSCVSCQKYHKIFKQISTDLQKKSKFITVNCSNSNHSILCSKFNIKMVPQLSIIKYGQIEKLSKKSWNKEVNKKNSNSN